MAALNGTPADHVGLTTWCFGLKAPEHLRWQRDGREVEYWYSMRVEHLHTLAQPWTLEDDFKRVDSWLTLGIDDVLEVSVPWSQAPDVAWTDSKIPAGVADAYPVLVRQYETAAGSLRHAVRQAGEAAAEGWVIQPDCVPLFEDYHIPRALEHAVSSASDIQVIAELYAGPNAEAAARFAERMAAVKRFADEREVLVQAWSAFGMDAVVWLAGTQPAIMMAMDDPAAFRKLVEIVARTDYARTELAASTEGVDLVVQRGWYSATDFWSPTMFDEFVRPYTEELAALAHRHGKKFGYVMTTGVELLGQRLADAGVDVLFFVDPVQDGISPDRAKELLGDRMTLVGGTNALSLAAAEPDRIRREVQRAIEVLAPTNRFVLHPVDALFPDTPWEGVMAMIEAWKECW